MDSRTPDAMSTRQENELICEKLLGWARAENLHDARGRASWSQPTGPAIYTVTTPGFATWAEAGLILEALQANQERSFPVLRSLSKILKGGLLEPADVRAAALVHIGSSS